jgi:hypothetical protein
MNEEQLRTNTMILPKMQLELQFIEQTTNCTKRACELMMTEEKMLVQNICWLQ